MGQTNKGKTRENGIGSAPSPNGNRSQKESKETQEEKGIMDKVWCIFDIDPNSYEPDKLLVICTSEERAMDVIKEFQGQHLMHAEIIEWEIN